MLVQMILNTRNVGLFIGRDLVGIEELGKSFFFHSVAYAFFSSDEKDRRKENENTHNLRRGIRRMRRMTALIEKLTDT